MAAEEEHRRRLIACLGHALQQPNSFQRLVDRLLDANAIHGLQVWGAMRGLYPDTGGMGGSKERSYASPATEATTIRKSSDDTVAALDTADCPRAFVRPRVQVR